MLILLLCILLVVAALAYLLRHHRHQPKPQDYPAEDTPLQDPPEVSSPFPEHHVLCLGNSITYHPYKPEIGWRSEHGMAASSPQHDYVHQLQNLMQNLNPRSTCHGVNIAEWETTFHLSLPQLLHRYPHPIDIIVLRVGENVRNVSAFAPALETLIRQCQQWVPAVVVSGCVWRHTAKEQALLQAAQACEIPFVPLDWIMALHPDTYPHVGDTLMNRQGQPYTIPTPFICTHPNDKGMAMIAATLFKYLPL